MKSTDIIGYTHEDGFLACVSCYQQALIGGMPPTDNGFSPFFEDDRQGEECCDNCFSPL